MRSGQKGCKAPDIPMEQPMPKAFIINPYCRRAVKRIVTFLPVLLSIVWPAFDARAAANDPDTLHLLALRAEFVADNLATTNGDGKFLLNASADYKIDRPPHNRTYFQHQLLALHNYFNRVSRGRVILQADVFPLEENRAYTLNQNMVYYSGEENKDTQKLRWAELLRDALLAAETEGGIDFSRYQCVVVFHAGVGNDFAFDLDTTPYDIQSVYLDFETLLQTLGKQEPGFQGIRVGGSFIANGIILPEMQNQEGLDLGLLGTMTLLMGSRLGMPTLFESATGRTGIGRWGLMDQGSYNFQGLIPAEPSAWEKVHMGWETPVVVRQGDAVRIGCSSAQSAPHIIKVPVDAKEYFLIENRVRDRNRDKITLGRDESGNRIQFDSTGRAVSSGDFGVITRVDEYDFGLPGDGLLIWHIDERLIEAQASQNTFNDNRTHRGVDLEECDGAQDLGYVYDMFDAGYGTENGDYYDAWWDDNESHKIVHNSEQVMFSPITAPNSNAYNGAVTHITLDQFSKRDTVMTLRIRSDLAQPGFPITLSSSVGKAGLAALDLGNGNGSALFAAGRDGRVYGWHGNGQSVTSNSDGLLGVTADSIDQPVAACCAYGNYDAQVVVVDRSGQMVVWQRNAFESNWIANKIELAARPSSGPMILVDEINMTIYKIIGLTDGRCLLVTENQISKTIDLNAGRITGLAQWKPDGTAFVVATETGVLACYTTAAQKVWQQQLSTGNHHWQPLVADFSNEAGMEILAVSDAGDCWLVNNQGQARPIGSWSGPLSEPSAGDIDADGAPEILLSNGSQLLAFETTGVTVLNFPFTLGPQPSEQPLSPLWIESKSFLNSWAFAADAMGLIWGVTPAGNRQSGYPLTAGGEIRTTPLLHDLDQDGDMELVLVSPDQLILAWSLPLVSQNNRWTHWGADADRTFILYRSVDVTPSSKELLPAKKVFCYPNPTKENATAIRYTLTQNVSSVSIRIFDMAGDLVADLPAPGVGSGDHEVIWKVDNIDSGVYIARVQAQSGKDSPIKFIKIAVIK